jgi:alpha-L-rhamnosidase
MYRELADEVAKAFRARYLLDSGRLTCDSQTAYAIAIAFKLLDDVRATRQAGDRLVELVRGNGYRIATSFIGTPLICDALTSTGHIDAAYRLLMQTECPSWLYPVTQGATTIWERWDSLRPDGTLNPGGMTSFNHVALGSVAGWLHRVAAGLAPAAPGYKKISFYRRPAAADRTAGRDGAGSRSRRRLSRLGLWRSASERKAGPPRAGELDTGKRRQAPFREPMGHGPGQAFSRPA